MNINLGLTKGYENEQPGRPGQNEPNLARRWCGGLARSKTTTLPDLLIYAFTHLLVNAFTRPRARVLARHPNSPAFTHLLVYTFTRQPICRRHLQPSFPDPRPPTPNSPPSFVPPPT